MSCGDSQAMHTQRTQAVIASGRFGANRGRISHHGVSRDTAYRTASAY